MVKNLFEDFRKEFRRDRQISVFKPDHPSIKEAEVQNAMTMAFEDVEDMTKMMESALESIEDHAESLLIPIEEYDNEVRAAHLRQGGDGKFITFAQFQRSINESKKSRTDYAFNYDLKGQQFADKRRVEQNRMVKGLQTYAQQNGGDIGEFGLGDAGSLGGFGMQGLLLMGLNKLIGLNHAQDHSAVTSGKYPPGTETGGVVSQILQAVVMMKFLHGMTEEMAESYADVAEVQIPGVDMGSIIKEGFAAEPPRSKSFELMRSGLAASDHELIAHHSSSYCAKHIGDGFETWYAYLSTREMHERGLRESANAKAYREGHFQGDYSRARGLTKLANAGIGELARIQKVLNNGLSVADSCCLTRFMLSIDTDFLEVARTVVSMSIAVLEAQASLAFDQTVDMMMSPLKAIRSEVMGLLDEVMEQVVDKVLDWANMEGPVADIIRACTPVGELFTSIVDQVEWIQDWYTEMLKSFEDDTEAYIKLQAGGWEVVHRVKEAKEQLRMILRMIDEREAMMDASMPESQVLGLVDEIKGYRIAYEIDVNIYDQVIRDMKRLVQNEMSVSDRGVLLNRIDNKLAAAGVPEENRISLRSRLSNIADEKNASKLNEALSYVEELVGDTGRGPVSATNRATAAMIDWCKTIGDWDRLKGLLGAEVDDTPKPKKLSGKELEDNG